MDSIREYLLHVIVAAILCGILTSIIDGKSTVGVTVKLVAGLLLVLVAVRPWTDIKMDHIFDWAQDIYEDGRDSVAIGEDFAEENYRNGIKERVEAYILDEAKALDCLLTVEVILSDGELPVPRQIRLTGDASPYARQALTALLSERLGIEREDLIWT